MLVDDCVKIVVRSLALRTRRLVSRSSSDILTLQDYSDDGLVKMALGDNRREFVVGASRILQILSETDELIDGADQYGITGEPFEQLQFSYSYGDISIIIEFRKDFDGILFLFTSPGTRRPRPVVRLFTELFPYEATMWQREIDSMNDDRPFENVSIWSQQRR